MRALWMAGVFTFAAGCATTAAQKPLELLPEKSELATSCGNGKPMRVHFFDASRR